MTQTIELPNLSAAMQDVVERLATVGRPRKSTSDATLDACKRRGVIHFDAETAVTLTPLGMSYWDAMNSAREGTPEGPAQRLARWRAAGYGKAGGSAGDRVAETMEQVVRSLAAQHLERRGLTVLDIGARTRFGDIDVIAHGNVSGTATLVFAKVTGRRAGQRPNVLEDPDPTTVRAVRKLAATWLNETTDRPSADAIRFDLIGVTIGERSELVSLDHLENAL